MAGTAIAPRSWGAVPLLRSARICHRKTSGMSLGSVREVHGGHVGCDPNKHVLFHFVGSGGQLARQMRRTNNMDSAAASCGGILVTRWPQSPQNPGKA